MRVFISHSSKDASIAEEICALLEANHANCFIAPRDIRSGKEYAEEIMNGIQSCDAMVLIMSKEANKSPHVLREVERGVSRGIPILVYKLEDVELSKSMEYFLMTHQWLSPEKKNNYSEIIQFVKNFDISEVPEIKKTEISTPSSPKKKINPFLFWGICTILLVTIIGGIFLCNNRTPKLKTGDIITFGTYNDEPIEWCVLKLSDDGKEAILIANQIITMKAYDAAEGGTFNSDGINDYWSENTKADTDYSLQIKVRGNNDWTTSNIRTWLNSDAQIVEYKDQPPTPSAMSESYNGYHQEPGFLSYFTMEEKDALIPTELNTTANVLSSTPTVTTKDLVFLLSKEELQWFYDAGLSLYTSPTAAAIEQDTSYWYDIDTERFQTDTFYWWLREPVEGSASKCYMVSNGYTEEIYTVANVGTEGFGIRPAITVDLTSKVFR